MFERFTDKAIKVMLLAQEEARRLGHNFVGTEQILLGLIGEGTGVAAQILAEQNINLKTARQEVEKIIGHGSGAVAAEIPFTHQVKQLLGFVTQEAQRLGSDEIRTEHLLLGLLQQKDDVLIRILESLNIQYSKLRIALLKRMADEAENDVQGISNCELSQQTNSNPGKENFTQNSEFNLYSDLNLNINYLANPQAHEANVPDEWQEGDSILEGLYQVEALLGEGGFGKVYRVFHRDWKIHLAVKTPRLDKLTEIGGVENFIQEAETWVKLGLHPHIVSCFYVRKLGKSPRVFVEFIGGGSLHSWIYSGKVPKLYQGGQAESLKRILDIAIQFAWGLHYSHEQGLIHQDVKPGNTMMAVDGTVKVTDFGLARAKSGAVSTTELSLDQTLQVQGSGSTPAYCSPEQAKGAVLTRRTDLYSWALSVLEMFKGGRRWDLGAKVTSARQFYLESEPYHSHTPTLPRTLAELLWVCFREDPNRRPHTMLDVANALKGIYRQEIGEAYPRPEPETGKDIADGLNNRAVSLLDLGQVEEAMRLWDQALKMNPLHPESTYNRGLILWRACRITDDILVKDLQKVRDTNEDNWTAHYLLALVHLERNNCEEAIQSLHQIQGELAQHPEVQQALALAQERLPNSNRFVKELVELDIDNPILSVCITPDGKLGLSSGIEKTKNQLHLPQTHRNKEHEQNSQFYLQLVQYLASTVAAFSKPVLKRICSNQHQSKFN